MDLKERIEALIAELEGKEKITDEQTRRMFNLHNEAYPKNPEYTVSCGACRKRVWGKIKAWAGK